MMWFGFYRITQTMMTSFLCKVPSGSSTMQIIQFGQEVNYGFFGKYMDSSKIPDDFELSRINIPISLHYSPIDKFTNPTDVNRLISKLSHTIDFVQTVDSPFNHMDFVWSKYAVSIVYSKILDFFSKYQWININLFMTKIDKKKLVKQNNSRSKHEIFNINSIKSSDA